MIVTLTLECRTRIVATLLQNPGFRFVRDPVWREYCSAVLADQVSSQLLTFELSLDNYVLERLGLSFELPELPSDGEAGFHGCQPAPVFQATVCFYREL